MRGAARGAGGPLWGAPRTLFFSLTCTHAQHTHTWPPRRRSRFLTGASPILLLTERYFYYFRTRIKGARRVLFYAPPTVPHFYAEVVNLLLGGLGEGSSAAAAVAAAASVTALYTRADALALERIVGTRRVAKLVDEGSARSTFTFYS